MMEDDKDLDINIDKYKEFRKSTSKGTTVPPPKPNTKSSGGGGKNKNNANIEISQPVGFKQISTPPVPSPLTKPSIFTLINSNSSTPTTSATTTSDQTGEKLYFKCSPELLQDVARWESTKQSYQRSIQELLEQKSIALESLFQEYLQEMQPILEQHNLDSEFKNDMINREWSRFESIKQKLFGNGNASITALELQISNRKKEINMHNKITLIQSIVRGWLAKKRYMEMKKKMEKRNQCILEILSTEKTYVNSLSLIITQFQQPLQSGGKKDLLSESEINSIFSNSLALYGIHKELLASLEDRRFGDQWNTYQSTIADCFQPWIPYLKLYTQYINNFNNSVSTLNECKKRDSKINNFFFKDCKNNQLLEHKDFLDLQIQPVQRIPRYKLLFTELLQNTPPSHKDYELISNALKAIQNIAQSINESKRNAEGLEKMIQVQGSLTSSHIELVQPHRKHIKDGPIMFEKRGVLKDRYLFLFNDSILLCKKAANIFDNSPRYSVITFMNLSGCIVLPLAQQQNYSLPSSDPVNLKAYGFAVLGREHLYFYTKNAVQELEWIENFKQVVKEIDQNLSTLRVETDTTITDPTMLVKETKSISDLNNISNSNNKSFNRLSNHSSNSNNNEKQNNVPLVIERNSRLSTSYSPPFPSNSSTSQLEYSPTSYSPPMNRPHQHQQSQQLQSSPPPQYQANPNLNQRNSFDPSILQFLNNNNNYNNNLSQPLPQPVQQQNKTIRELIDIMTELNQLYNQLFNPIEKVQGMFNNDALRQILLQQPQLGQTINTIVDILNRIVGQRNRCIELLKQDNIAKQLQEVITMGKDNIGAFSEWIKRTYPQNDVGGQQPRFLVINLMKWYNNLFTVWKSILDQK